MIFVSGCSFIPNVDAFTPDKVITTASTGESEISFRNIDDLSTGDSPNMIFTLQTTYRDPTVGITATVDSTANFDQSKIDIITVDVTQGSSTIQVDLTETDTNSGIFTGSFESFTNAAPSISYNPPASFSGRFQGTLQNVVSEGTVIIKDIPIDDFDENAGVGAIIDSVDLQLGTAQIESDSGITVALSWANGLFGEDSPDDLCLWHQYRPGYSWEILTYQLSSGGTDPSTHQGVLITNQYQPTRDGVNVDPTGRYVLGFCDGRLGGGGGGISRSGLIVQALGALSLTSGGSQVNAPPTLGLGQNQKRIVDNGFSFNDNPINVLQYYTPYPMVTTPVGQNNTVKLKIYEEEGLNNIAHVGLSYGLGKGETFNEGRATIEYDKTFDGKVSVTTFDPNHVLGDVNVTTTDVRCGEESNAVCREFTFYHVFREPLEYNMVATNIWDFQLNGWQNYFNHGVQITGESMNPPNQYSGIFEGHIYTLTETGKNTAIDENGNTWTNNKTWTRDYIKPIVVDSNILNDQKISAIEHLGFGYSDGQAIFGFDRMDHRFTDAKEQQKNQAQSIMNDICPKCQNVSYDKINNIFSYTLPPTYSKLDNPAIVNQMHIEDQKARQLLQEYFDPIHHKSIN